MCGRYLFSAEQNAELTQIVKAVERRYGQTSVPQGEIRPTAVMPVLHEEHGSIQPVLQTWGYKLPTSLVINARAESVLEKPLFRDSVRQRRCIVPTSGFYEWDAEKHKYFFQQGRNQAMYLAGLTLMRNGAPSYCIITTAANDSMKTVHDRMPLILSKEQAADWILDSSATEDLLHLIPERQSLLLVEGSSLAQHHHGNRCILIAGVRSCKAAVGLLKTENIIV